MKKSSILLAATLLAGSTFAAVSAQALTINLGGDLGVGVVISGDDGDLGVGVGVDANVNANTNTNTNGGNTTNGNTNVGVGVGVDANANANTNTNGNANTNANAGVAADAMIHIRGEGDEDLTFDLDALLDVAVWTEDGVQIGTVDDTQLDADGRGMIYVDLTDGWVEGMDRIAIRASAMVHTNAGLQLDDNADELHAAIMAAVAANVTTTTTTR